MKKLNVVFFNFIKPILNEKNIGKALEFFKNSLNRIEDFNIENLVKNRFEGERAVGRDSIRFLTTWLTSLRPREPGFAISRCQASFWSVL